jgi:hypothetical protein
VLYQGNRHFCRLHNQLTSTFPTPTTKLNQHTSEAKTDYTTTKQQTKQSPNSKSKKPQSSREVAPKKPTTTQVELTITANAEMKKNGKSKQCLQMNL